MMKGFVWNPPEWFNTRLFIVSVGVAVLFNRLTSPLSHSHVDGLIIFCFTLFLIVFPFILPSKWLEVT